MSPGQAFKLYARAVPQAWVEGIHCFLNKDSFTEYYNKQLASKYKVLRGS